MIRSHPYCWDDRFAAARQTLREVEMGHERRVLQKTAARQLPLCFVSDRDRAAVQHVAKSQKLKCRRRIASLSAVSSTYAGRQQN
jgi:hypothetical protein